MAAQKDSSNPLSLLTDVAGIVGASLTEVISAVHSTHGPIALRHLLKLAHAGMGAIDGNKHAVTNYTRELDTAIGLPEEIIGTPIIETLIRGGLGIDPDYNHKPLEIRHGKPNWKGPADSSWVKSDSAQGIATLKRLVGFSILLPVTFTGLETVLKLLGAQRVSSAIAGTLGKMTESIGLNFALGMAISQLMEVAMGRQLEELANVQLHPNRLDMMTVRQLARQHHITEEQYWAALDLLGYPDDLKTLLLQLDTQQVTLNDLQALWVTGKVSRTYVKEYMGKLGFSDGDIDLLLTEYIDHAETQASTMFRTMVRTAHSEQRITDDQFADLLTQILMFPQVAPVTEAQGKPHYDSAPEQVRGVVDLELAAGRFASKFGRTQQSVTTLKQLFKTGHTTPSETVGKLQSLGYSADDANNLMLTWSMGPQAGKPALTSSKILSYEKSGVFNPEAAYQKLLNLGLTHKDAAFLANNPDPKVGPWVPPFSVQTVLQAYMDDAATQQEAEHALAQLGLNTQEISTELEIAHYRKTHKLILDPKEAGVIKTDVQALFMARALHDQETINLLEELGMAQSDAAFLWAAWYTQREGHPPPSPLPLVSN